MLSSSVPDQPLMLACELALAGVRPLVLERRSTSDSPPKANGLAGQIVQLLDYRGLLESFSAEASFVGVADMTYGRLNPPPRRLSSALSHRCICRPKVPRSHVLHM
jgi:2-polyprenyl-6-methoxyphenol hydroxylase-like FAD-dependent oxidoreductase